jgi:hypothetical protein
MLYLGADCYFVVLLVYLLLLCCIGQVLSVIVLHYLVAECWLSCAECYLSADYYINNEECFSFHYFHPHGAAVRSDGLCVVGSNLAVGHGGSILWMRPHKPRSRVAVGVARERTLTAKSHV